MQHFKHILFGAGLLLILMAVPTLSPQIAHADASCVNNPSIGPSGIPVFSCTISDLTPACQAATDRTSAACNASDQQVLGALGLNTLTPGSQNTPETQAAVSAGTAVSGRTSCSGFGNFLYSPFTCVFRAFVVGFSSVIVSATSWLLVLAGNLFNWLVINTIVLFKTKVYDFISTSLELGWKAFRDIANILIIGMFVFIAINIILGRSGEGQFGQKKLIARILIVAVLINFSLLFAKLIIDGSNFTASQFYTAATFNSTAQTTGGQTAGASGTGNVSISDVGISGKFLKDMGITGVGDTAGKLWDVAEAQDSGWVALVHGLFIATVFLGAALVLLYGSWLLVTRAILLIFLLLTSSIAFATYMMPSKSMFYSKGWDLWWSTLLRTAVFAPILMIFLWITMLVSNGLARTNGGLGGLLNDPSQGIGIDALFGYLIILGLLFASFKVANMFAKTIAGFGEISGVLGSAFKMAGNMAATATTGLGGSALRRGIGGFAYRQAEERTKGAKSAEGRRADAVSARTLATSTRDTAIQKAEEFRAQGRQGRAQVWDRRAARATTAITTATHVEQDAENERNKQAISAARYEKVAGAKFGKKESYTAVATKQGAEVSKIVGKNIQSPQDVRRREEDMARTVTARREAEYAQRQRAVTSANLRLTATQAMVKPKMEPPGEIPLNQQLSSAETTHKNIVREYGDTQRDIQKIAKPIGDAINEAIRNNPSIDSRGEYAAAVKEENKTRVEVAKNIADKTSAYDTKMKDLTEKIAQVAKPEDREAIQRDIETSSEAHASELRHENMRIEAAQREALTVGATIAAQANVQIPEGQELNRLRELSNKKEQEEKNAKEAVGEIRTRIAEIQVPVVAAENELKKAREALPNRNVFNDQTKQQIEDMNKLGREARQRSTDTLTATMAAWQGGILGRKSGVANKDVANAARGRLRTEREDQNLRRVLQRQLDSQAAENAANTPPPATPGATS